jgi:hypothetical protein
MLLGLSVTHRCGLLPTLKVDPFKSAQISSPRIPIALSLFVVPPILPFPHRRKERWTL